MGRIVDIEVAPEIADDQEAIRRLLEGRFGPFAGYRLLKRSLDARGKKIVFRLRCEIFDRPIPPSSEKPLTEYNVSRAREVFIAGGGPAGLFAALALIEAGLRPIIVERGKDVRARRRDLAALNREHVVNPDSNYCFGEGGAGTYSDGKLYTRSKKRGDVHAVLESLVAFGAPDSILIDAHPHIGTNKLPNIITAIREYIERCGGEVRFETKWTDVEVRAGRLSRLQFNGSEWVDADSLIVATGHSARDVFMLLHNRGIRLEAKPFALGVRVEHPQTLIDSIRYRRADRGPHLPPASYSLVHQAGGQGVYSFCMCPGGIIAPCATSPGEIVTNGWSPSKRNNPFANSGLVVSVDPTQFDPRDTGHPLAALEYQQSVETAAWQAGGGGQTAPAQRLVDFTTKKLSDTLPACSYLPGVRSADLHGVLPPAISERLNEALQAFGRKMKGFFTNEAILVATESRTSSPVRIPRTENMNHPEVEGLYPAGEGPGYAGGIVSAAIDGRRVAHAIIEHFAVGSRPL